MDSEPVQSRFRVDSEYDGTAGRTNIAPLEARALDGTADFAPSTSSDAVETARPGPVSRAFSTAANQTSGAFRTARRAVRSVF